MVRVTWLEHATLCLKGRYSTCWVILAYGAACQIRTGELSLEGWCVTTTLMRHISGGVTAYLLFYVSLLFCIKICYPPASWEPNGQSQQRLTITQGFCKTFLVIALCFTLYTAIKLWALKANISFVRLYELSTLTFELYSQMSSDYLLGLRTYARLKNRQMIIHLILTKITYNWLSSSAVSSSAIFFF